MAQPALVLRKFGVLIDLGTPGGGPLPEAIRDAFTAHMAYTHIKHLRGAERWDPITGLQRNVLATRILLHKLRKMQTPQARTRRTGITYTADYSSG